MLCTLFGTGIISFAATKPDDAPVGAAVDTSAEIQDQMTVIDNLLINVKDVDGKWAASSSAEGSTWEKQIAKEMKWLGEVYNNNKSNFVIKETLPITEAKL